MKEGWNFAPDKRDRWSEPKEKLVSPERRKFLGALAAFGGTAAASGTALTYLESLEKKSLRERLIDAAVQSVCANIRSKEIHEALRSGERSALDKIIRAMEFPILPQHLAGTSYDIGPRSKKYQTQIAMYLNAGNELTLSDRASIHSAADSRGRPDLLTIQEAAYGNGTYWEDPHTLITAAHVVSMLHPEKKQELDNKEIDVGLIRVNKRFAAHEHVEVLRDNARLRNENIHGAFVAIAGIDPDDTSDTKGSKIYPGVAVKMTEPLTAHIMHACTEGVIVDKVLQKRLARSFMLVLPPGESYEDKTRIRPAKGMSGSAILARKDGQFSFGGIFWGAFQVKVGNKCVDLGFFHGIDEVREATKEIKVEFIPER